MRVGALDAPQRAERIDRRDKSAKVLVHGCVMPLVGTPLYAIVIQ
jgi:hypothetical protein